MPYMLSLYISPLFHEVSPAECLLLFHVFVSMPTNEVILNRSSAFFCKMSFFRISILEPFSSCYTKDMLAVCFDSGYVSEHHVW
jgi:hypothetical protein